MKEQDITIGIVSYYRGKALKRCIESLSPLFNIIVFDNNTTGEDLEDIKEIDKNFSNVRVIYNPENEGLTKAWNRVTVESKTDWVILTCDDMIFDEDWFQVLNNILSSKPQLEQIHLNSFNCIALHKKTIVRMGWWDERYRYYPSMEDDDWYLRTVELLEYSPYTKMPKHLIFPDYHIKLIKPFLNKVASLHDRSDNFTYFCNSPYSKHKIIGKSTITGNEDDAGSRNNINSNPHLEMNGIQFHHKKWEPVDLRKEPLENSDIILGKDGRCWKRVGRDIDFYPEVRKLYAKKYFNIEL